jgi:hypothetical protein
VEGDAPVSNPLLDEDGPTLRLAVHEAGHTITAEGHGVGVVRTQLFDDGTGVTWLDWSNRTVESLKPHEVGPLMAVFAGGLVAERYWAQRSGEAVGQEYTTARGDMTTLGWLEELPGAVSFDEAETMAMDAVGSRWGEVMALAHELRAAPPSWWSGTRTVRA